MKTYEMIGENTTYISGPINMKVAKFSISTNILGTYVPFTACLRSFHRCRWPCLSACLRLSSVSGCQYHLVE